MKIIFKITITFIVFCCMIMMFLIFVRHMSSIDESVYALASVIEQFIAIMSALVKTLLFAALEILCIYLIVFVWDK